MRSGTDKNRLGELRQFPVYSIDLQGLSNALSMGAIVPLNSPTGIPQAR